MEALNEAGELQMSGDHFINPEQIFTPEYSAMTEKQKAEFLRKALAELHFSLVFNEVYNSCFTEERVEDDRRRTLKYITDNNDVVKLLGRKRHNVAHSMVYKTFQPISVYDMDQRHFDYKMRSTADTDGDIEEYPFHRLILAVLNEFKKIKEEKEDNTKVLVDFWNKNRNPIFGNGVADALSEQDTDLAAGNLLELLKKEKKDKGPLAAILYRLEFGRIGISEEGAQYLERMYDLGEYNNPGYHVSRLTADGEIGVFDEELKLIKFFALGDLSTPETRVQAKVLDFTYETLFVGKEGESAEEREKRLQYLEEFKQHYYKIAQDKMFKETGVRLNNLSFKEQGWFIIYFIEADEAGKERLRKFVADHDEEGIKTFLALEGGEKSGGVILDLGQKLDKETASRVFGKFNELANFIKKSGEELSQEFFNNDKTVEPHAEILKRAGQILVDFQKNLPEDIASMNEEERKKLFFGIREKLNNIKTDAAIFASILRTAYEGKIKINLQEIKGVGFHSCFSSELTADDQEQILAIAVKNYEADNLQQRDVLEKIKQAFNNGEKTKWYFLKKYDEKSKRSIIMSFGRFDEEKDGSLHAASLNINPEFEGLPLGGIMYQYGLEHEAPNRRITAECQIDKEVTRHYLERGGFVAYDIETNPKTGILYFKISRDDSVNPKYQSRIGRPTQEGLRATAKEQGHQLMTLKLKDSLSVEQLKSQLEMGFVVTRFFPSRENEQEYNCVLERRITALQDKAAA